MWTHYTISTKLSFAAAVAAVILTNYLLYILLDFRFFLNAERNPAVQ